MQRRPKKRAIIFLNTDAASSLSTLPSIHPEDVIICVDGGLRHAQKHLIIPHIILGDFDSLPDGSRTYYQKTPVEWIAHEPKNDQYETDSELALRVARKRGITECIIYRFSGDRLDHMTANLFLFARYAKTMSITLREPHQHLDFIHDTHRWTGKPGDLISLIPLTGLVRGTTTNGLQYPLKNATLRQGTTVGISNVMTTSWASVTISHGLLLGVYTPL